MCSTGSRASKVAASRCPVATARIQPRHAQTSRALKETGWILSQMLERIREAFIPPRTPTVAREKIDTNASQIFKIDEDTEDAENEQYHGNDDLTETDVSDDLLCPVIKKLSTKRKQRQTTVREGNLKRPRLTEATSHDDFGVGVCKAYSRCSVPYFSEVANRICKNKNKVELIRSTGFGYMLELDDCLVPRPFTRWIADKVIVEDEEITINNKRIPSGDINISVVDDAGKSEFLAFFGLSEVSTIKFLAARLYKEKSCLSSFAVS